MDYRTVVDSGQLEASPTYDKDELQRAVDARDEWVRTQLGRYAGHLEEPTDDFKVTIDNEEWHVVECWTGDCCRCVLLQRGSGYMLYDEFWGTWLFVRFVVDATGMESSPPRGYEPFPLVNVQRALARAEMLGLWS